MVCRAYSFLPSGKWSSLSSLLEVALIIPKGIIEDLPHLSPYPSTPFPSISPSPYPSILTILLSLIIFLPPPLSLPTPYLSPHLAILLQLAPTSCSISKGLLIQCVVLPFPFPLPRGSFYACILSRVTFGFMVHHPQVNFPSSSHAPSLFDHLVMSSPRSSLQVHFSPSLGSVYHEIPLERIILDVIAGVGEGWLQEISWEALLLIL